jgi:hypothetical protein
VWSFSITRKNNIDASVFFFNLQDVYRIEVLRFCAHCIILDLPNSWCAWILKIEFVLAEDNYDLIDESNYCCFWDCKTWMIICTLHFIWTKNLVALFM